MGGIGVHNVKFPKNNFFLITLKKMLLPFLFFETFSGELVFIVAWRHLRVGFLLDHKGPTLRTDWGWRHCFWAEKTESHTQLERDVGEGPTVT